MISIILALVIGLPGAFLAMLGVAVAMLPERDDRPTAFAAFVIGLVLVLAALQLVVTR